MDILVPKNIFLRVADKFVPRFVNRDKAVNSNATLLYKRLFEEAYETGKCRLPQHMLAEDCKFSIRALQNALRRLAALGYIHVERAPGGWSTYVLLRSGHVRRLLEGSELLERPDRYPRRDARRTESPSDSEPPHQVRGGYAPGAHPSYNVYKNNKSETSPPSPLPATHSGSGVSDVRGRGDTSFFPLKKQNLIQTFETLWAQWPVKQARHESLRVFRALARAGNLPAEAELLAAVERLRAQDDRWRRGYVPHLANWLRGMRWADSPVIREGRDGRDGLNGQAGQAPAGREDCAARAPAHAGEEIPPQLPDLPEAVESGLLALCSLWTSSAPIRPVRAAVRSMLARGSLPDMGAVLARAREHVESVASPGGLASWLMRQEWSFAA